MIGLLLQQRVVIGSLVVDDILLSSDGQISSVRGDALVLYFLNYWSHFFNFDQSNVRHGCHKHVFKDKGHADGLINHTCCESKPVSQGETESTKKTD